MKIGIISINMYSKGLNFACPLHTYAFQQFLLKNGIESTVINYKPIYFENFDLKHPYDYYMKRYQDTEKKEAVTQEEKEAKELKLLDLREKCENLKELYEEREIRYDKFQNFIDTRYIKTETCYDSDLLEVMDPGFDCYICATDVIWKNEPGFGYDRGFFLASTCMENKWKIAYAGSMNARKSKTPEEDEQFFQYINDIDQISVREKSLKRFIEKNTGRDATLVVDPVLLHEKEFYDDITVRPPEEHYLLLYYVMEKARDTLQQAVTYAKAHHLKIVELTERAESGGRLQEYTDVETVYRYGIGIEEWLGYIRYADCVFTNSFHACCFCALFEKKFFAGKRHGDKVSNILNLLGLSDRRINIKSDLINNEPPEIDYVEVGKRLKKWRKKSGTFILNAIHELEGKQKEFKDYVPYKKSLFYKIFYNSGLEEDGFTWNYTGVDGIVKKTASGTYEFQPNEYNAVNSGESKIRRNGFYHPLYQFEGWKIRFRIDNRWFWYLEDGSICLKSKYSKKVHAPIRIFEEASSIPYIPVNRIAVMVAVAVWKKSPLEHDAGNAVDKKRDMEADPGSSDCRNPVTSDFVNNELPEAGYVGVWDRLKEWFEESGAYIWDAIRKKNEFKDCVPHKKSFSYKVFYNTGLREDGFTWNYTGVDGIIEKTALGTYEFQPNEFNAVNNGESFFRRNGFHHPIYQFKGWKIHFQIGNRWFWYLEDGSIRPENRYNRKKHAPIRIFEEEASIPYIPVKRIAVMAAVAVWEKFPSEHEA